MPGSPAIDAGNTPLTTDQRGRVRPFDFAGVANAAGGNGSDIGAFELNETPQSGANFVVNQITDTDDGVCGPTDCTLREAINAANGDGDFSEISFDATVFAAKQTITLTLGSLPDFASDVTVSGPTARGAGVTVKGANNIIFQTNSGSVTLSALTVTNGYVGIFTLGGATTVQGCTLTGHFIGVQLNGGDLAVRNCTLSGNTNIGIINNSDNSNNNSNATVTNSTLSGNGSGISNLRGSTTTVSNSIVTDRNSNITDGGFNLIGVDAKLGPLADNGGPTQTFALLAGSPAIDAGSNALIPDGVVTDQRGPGFARIRGGVVDIGAFELDPPQSGANFVVNQTDDHDDGTCGTNDCTLREAIGAANRNGAGTDTISFSALFDTAQTITLKPALSEIAITASVTIDGPGARLLTVDAANANRVFGIGAGNTWQTGPPGSTTTISGLTLVKGRNGDSNGGGALFNEDTVTLNNCTLSGNTAGRGGGVSNKGTLTLNSCTLSGNTSRNSGGAIYNSGTLTLNSCTLSGNTSDALGGGILSSGTLTLNSSTLSGNSAGNGGGIFIFSGTFNSSNTIVAGNTAGTNPDLSGTINSGDYNLIGNSQGTIFGASANHNVINVDAQLGPLKNNGGPTDTIALLPGSPALNAGDPNFVGAGQFDQRGAGFARVVRGRLDIGAFEVQNGAPTVKGFSKTLNEDSTLFFAATDFSGAFSDPDKGDTLQSARIETLPANGTLNFNGAAATAGQVIAFADLGKLSFTPGANFNGATSFNYNASDAYGFAANAATVTLNVTPVNDTPSFSVGANQTVAEDAGSQSVAKFATNISAGPPNEAAQKLTFIVTNDNNALFSVQPAIDASGTLTYTLAPKAAGVATVSVKLQDDGGVANGGKDTSAAQNFAITVTANPLFIGVSLSPTGPFTRDTLTATPRIADSEGVTYNYNWFVNGTSVQNGASNTFDLNQPGHGDKGDRISVMLTARNARGGLGSATNGVTVRDSVPFAFSGTASAQSGVEAVIPFLLFGNPGGGDSDGDALTYKRVGGPKNGVAAFETDASGNNVLRYTARRGFVGVEVIRFVAVEDSGRTSNVATLAIDVKGVPIVPPTAEDASGVTSQGVAVDVPLVGNDPNGGVVTFKRVGGPVNGGGGLVTLADGTTVMHYIPRADFVGVEEIRYVALNAAGRPSNVATIRITVSASGASSIQAGAAPSAAPSASAGGA